MFEGCFLINRLHSPQSDVDLIKSFKCESLLHWSVTFHAPKCFHFPMVIDEDVFDMLPIFESILIGCFSLRSLKLYAEGGNYFDTPDLALSIVLRVCPHLSCLEFGGSLVTSPILDQIFVCMKSLETIVIRNCPAVNDKHLHLISKYLIRLKAIKLINVENVREESLNKLKKDLPLAKISTMI